MRSKIYNGTCVCMDTLGLITSVLQLTMIIMQGVLLYLASFGTTTKWVDNAGVRVLLLMNLKGNILQSKDCSALMKIRRTTTYACSSCLKLMSWFHCINVRVIINHTQVVNFLTNCKISSESQAGNHVRIIWCVQTPIKPRGALVFEQARELQYWFAQDARWLSSSYYFSAY